MLSQGGCDPVKKEGPSEIMLCMSISALVRLLEAAGYNLKLVQSGHSRTPEDILIEQRLG